MGAAALILCATLAAVSAQSPEPIFSDAASHALTRPAAAEARPFVVRSRVAALRAGTLARAMAAPSTTGFALNLFDDVTLAVAYERVEDSPFGHRSWIGHIDGRPASTVALTQKDDMVTGLVTDGDTSYEILGLGNGLARIEQMDTTRMPRDIDVVRPVPSGDPGAPAALPALSSPAATPVADIFVYYTSVLRTALGGQAQVQSRIAQAIVETNTAYQRSGIDGRLRLAGYAEMALDEPVDADALLSAFLVHPGAASQREATHADLMMVLTRSLRSGGSEICGIANVGTGNSSFAHSAVSMGPGCSYTFTHEVGHNFGAQHTDEDGVIAGPSYPAYARAYKAPNRAFRTVMAYNCNTQTGPSCPRILNYSAPDIYEGGQPTGTAMHDNARRVAETFAQVAAYREAGVPTEPPGAPRLLQAFVNGLDVTLQWQAPASGTFTSYRGVVSTTPGGANVANERIGLATSIGFTLPAGVYYVRMYAENAAGLSNPSNEVELTLAPIAPPGPPGLLGSSVNGSTVTLSWQPPTSGGAPTEYLLEAGSASRASNLLPGTPVYASGISFPGIPPGRYFARVRARNSAGISTPSSEAIIDVHACAAPAAPPWIVYHQAGNNVGVFWGAIGDSAASYRIDVGSALGAADYGRLPLGASTSVSSPLPTGTYYVRVRAATACGGVGPASSELTIVVP